MHNLKNDRVDDELPIRSIFSDIHTASYQLAKYWAKLLSPLSTSEYTIKSTSDFITHIKGPNILTLDFTIDVILKHIYDEYEVSTNIPKQKMRDLLLLGTKKVHFSYNGHIYTQTKGVPIGSPLVPVITGIFVVELERTTLPTLKEHMSLWKRYVDDTISYIKEKSTEHVLSKLNRYHGNIKFTYEIENNGKLPS